MGESKQVQCEKAMVGASTVEVCEALFTSFDGNDLIEIIRAIATSLNQGA